MIFMETKTLNFSNFSRAISSRSPTARPDTEAQLQEFFCSKQSQGLLARGHGLSYSDCCVNDKHTMVDTSRLNHMISFDPKTGIAVCQAAVAFSDLFLLHPEFIPPVVPGTLYVTVAGGVANDIHGKNNPHKGSFGHHIEWIELRLNAQLFRCSSTENTELFNATLAGLGLTGIITRVAIRMRKASHFVTKRTEKWTCMASLLQHMQHEGIQYDHQVAWLDLLNEPRALLSLANHVECIHEEPGSQPLRHQHTLAKLPIRLIYRSIMKQFNRAYYHRANTTPQTQSFWQFNNPLDAIHHWNRAYGSRGLLQFQAVFHVTEAHITLDTLLTIIKTHQATPTLAVLKYFTQAGKGLLSFTEPGFSIAIDFINNEKARHAIKAMNQLMTTLSGKVYLAKDLFLTGEQFTIMYPNHRKFCELITRINSPMSSSLSRRLGITRMDGQ
jgi:FAD/FMN-containing dehydrogenase